MVENDQDVGRIYGVQSIIRILVASGGKDQKLGGRDIWDNIRMNRTGNVARGLMQCVSGFSGYKRL
jgi:hypothetical protein